MKQLNKPFHRPHTMEIATDLFGYHLVPVYQPFDRTAIVLAYLEGEQESGEVFTCGKYGEPGYTDPAQGIVFANWNHYPRWFGDALERSGWKTEWSDEWIVDYDNDKAYRTQPDCYQWESQITYTDDGEMLTPDDSPSEWIDEMAMSDKGHQPRCVPSWITDDDLAEAGFELGVGELESGFHAGQDDDPAAIAKQFFAVPGVERVVFRKVENSQFYTRFEAWVQREAAPAGWTVRRDGDLWAAEHETTCRVLRAKTYRGAIEAIDTLSQHANNGD